MRPRLIKLIPEYNIKPFDCEDADLNGFLLETTIPLPLHGIDFLVNCLISKDAVHTHQSRSVVWPFLRDTKVKTGESRSFYC